MTLQNAQDTSLGIGLDTLVPDLAVQPVFIGRLDAGLADVRRPPIVDLTDTLELALVDAADIADDVNAESAQRIVPRQPRSDVHPRESVPIDREPRDLPVLEPQAQRDLLEPELASDGGAERLLVGIGDLDDPAQLREEHIEVVDCFRNDLEAVARQVLRQNPALAIEDESSRRRNRNDLDPIVLRQRGEVPMLEYLEMGKPPDENERQYSRDDRCPGGTRGEQHRFARRIPARQEGGHWESVLPRRLRAHSRAAVEGPWNVCGRITQRHTGA